MKSFRIYQFLGTAGLGFMSGYMYCKMTLTDSPLYNNKKTQDQRSFQNKLTLEPISFIPHDSSDTSEKIQEEKAHRPHKSLSTELVDAYQNVEKLPYARKNAEWAEFLTDKINRAEYQDLSEILLNPSTDFYLKMAAEPALTGGTLWDDLVGRSLFQISKLNRTDDLMIASESQFETGDTQLKTLSASITAAIFASGDFASTQRINDFDTPYQSAIKEKLLLNYSKFDRKQGFNFLLSDTSGYEAPQNIVDGIFNDSWFKENANELSRLVDAAPPSLNRNLLINKMVQLVAKTDLEAAFLWTSEITDVALREKLLNSISVKN